jgi:hypothetical protein
VYRCGTVDITKKKKHQLSAAQPRAPSASSSKSTRTRPRTLPSTTTLAAPRQATQDTPTQMTLPANDAFTLGLAHDDTRRRPHQSRSRSLPRSPSPKISFSSSKPTMTATHTSRVERGLARRASKHTSSNQHKDGSGGTGDTPNSLTKPAQPPLQEIEEKREDSPTPSPATPIQKMDWEVPRKLLHSSIGASIIVSHSHPRLTHTPSRISHFVPVLFKRIAQTCRCHPWIRPRRCNCTSRCHSPTIPTV